MGTEKDRQQQAARRRPQRRDAVARVADGSQPVPGAPEQAIGRLASGEVLALQRLTGNASVVRRLQEEGGPSVSPAPAPARPVVRRLLGDSDDTWELPSKETEVKQVSPTATARPRDQASEQYAGRQEFKRLPPPAPAPGRVPPSAGPSGAPGRAEVGAIPPPVTHRAPPRPTPAPTPVSGPPTSASFLPLPLAPLTPPRVPAPDPPRPAPASGQPESASFLPFQLPPDTPGHAPTPLRVPAPVPESLRVPAPAPEPPRPVPGPAQPEPAPVSGPLEHAPFLPFPLPTPELSPDEVAMAERLSTYGSYRRGLREGFAATFPALRWAAIVAEATEQAQRILRASVEATVVGALQQEYRKKVGGQVFQGPRDAEVVARAARGAIVGDANAAREEAPRPGLGPMGPATQHYADLKLRSKTEKPSGSPPPRPSGSPPEKRAAWSAAAEARERPAPKVQPSGTQVADVAKGIRRGLADDGIAQVVKMELEGRATPKKSGKATPSGELAKALGQIGTDVGRAADKLWGIRLQDFVALHSTNNPEDYEGSLGRRLQRYQTMASGPDGRARAIDDLHGQLTRDAYYRRGRPGGPPSVPARGELDRMLGTKDELAGQVRRMVGVVEANNARALDPSSMDPFRERLEADLRGYARDKAQQMESETARQVKAAVVSDNSDFGGGRNWLGAAASRAESLFNSARPEDRERRRVIESRAVQVVSTSDVMSSLAKLAPVVENLATRPGNSGRIDLGIEIPIVPGVTATLEFGCEASRDADNLLSMGVELSFGAGVGAGMLQAYLGAGVYLDASSMSSGKTLMNAVSMGFYRRFKQAGFPYTDQIWGLGGKTKTWGETQEAAMLRESRAFVAMAEEQMGEKGELEMGGSGKGGIKVDAGLLGAGVEVSGRGGTLYNKRAFGGTKDRKASTSGASVSLGVTVGPLSGKLSASFRNVSYQDIGQLRPTVETESKFGASLTGEVPTGAFFGDPAQRATQVVAWLGQLAGGIQRLQAIMKDRSQKPGDLLMLATVAHAAKDVADAADLFDPDEFTLRAEEFAAAQASPGMLSATTSLTLGYEYSQAADGKGSGKLTLDLATGHGLSTALPGIGGFKAKYSHGQRLWTHALGKK